MTTLNVPDSPKMLHETLCRAATALAQTTYADTRIPHDLDRIGRLLSECERHRPLGPDGRHGDLHTPTCGCADAPRRPWWRHLWPWRRGER